MGHTQLGVGERPFCGLEELVPEGRECSRSEAVRGFRGSKLGSRTLVRASCTTWEEGALGERLLAHAREKGASDGAFGNAECSRP